MKEVTAGGGDGFLLEPMSKPAATEILNWRYPYPYDFYNNEATDESIAEMLDGTYRIMRGENGKIFGFYCTGKSAQVPAGREMGAYPDGFIDFGLGMRPAETGLGNGEKFFSYIRQEILNNNSDQPLRLTVATFNRRAIRLYEKFGFVKGKEFTTAFATFQTMTEMEPGTGERKYI